MAKGIKNSAYSTYKVYFFFLLYKKEEHQCLINKKIDLSISPIPSTDGNNPFSVAFNSLYNYGNSDSNQNGGTVLNGSSNIGNNGANSQTSVARSTSSHTLDLDQDNRKRKDLEYKLVTNKIYFITYLC